MSIRRQSCDPCFKARRKCDLEYPVCTRCLHSSKECRYAYPPQLSRGSLSKTANNGVVSTRPANHSPALKRKRGASLALHVTGRPGISRYIGHLGELSPFSDAAHDSWVIQQIRSYPLMFATQAETIFIHKDLYNGSLPRPLLAAFGICAGCAHLSERNRTVLFQAVDAEVSDLLASAPTGTLLDDLTKLQAAVLYQTIRLFYGGIEQQIVAERQEYPIRSYALKLLRRTESELQSVPQSWEAWILAESVRRTVLIAFKLYTIYQAMRHGECSETSAIALLPVSSKPNMWDSRDAFMQDSDQDETMTYEEFAFRRGNTALAELRPIEKLIVTGCSGAGSVKSLPPSP